MEKYLYSKYGIILTTTEKRITREINKIDTAEELMEYIKALPKKRLRVGEREIKMLYAKEKLLWLVNESR